MSALLATLVGILAVGYAAWPLIRGRETPPLTEEPGHRDEEAEAETASLLAWSAAAGEIRCEAEPAGPLERFAC